VEMTGRKILVTGGAGMLGSYLVRRFLADGHQVRSIDLHGSREDAPGLAHTVGDVRDAALLTELATGVDVLVHCAAALPSYGEAEIRSVIVDGTRTVIGAAVTASVEHIVHISSTAVYGLPTTVPAEDHPRQPVDPYSRAKAAAEEICEAARTRHSRISILRPKTFLGPGRMGLFAMLFEWADEGRNFPVLGRGDVRIQMFALEDLVDAVCLVLAAPAAVVNDTFNLGAAEFATLREDFQAVLDAAGHGRRVVALPARPALTALRVLERSRLSPVYGRLLHKLTADSYVDIGKAQRILGFAPRYSNRDAILRTYTWWRENRSGSSGGTAGRTSSEPWRQGALSLAKVFF
jgi:nucleoside-diphosphate-sugar epimerase